jgi:hypothetical protein
MSASSYAKREPLLRRYPQAFSSISLRMIPQQWRRSVARSDRALSRHGAGTVIMQYRRVSGSKLKNPA